MIFLDIGEILEKGVVVYGDSSSHICGGATGGDVSHVSGSSPIRKYVLRMHNRKLHNMRPKGAFFTGSEMKRPCLAVLFSPDFLFPVLFISYLFPVLFFLLFSGTFFFRTFFPVLFSRNFFRPSFLVVVQNVGW